MGRRFVVAAGKHGTVGGDDAAGPETVTGTAAGTMEMIQPVLAQAVAAVAGRRGHERVTVLIIIELRCLESKVRCAKTSVVAAYPCPFGFVGGQAEYLQLYADMRAVPLLCRAEIAQARECQRQMSAYTVGGVRLRGEAVNGNDNAAQARRHETLCHIRRKRLRVGGDNGVHPHAAGKGNHVGQCGIEQRFPLKIELHGMCRGLYLRENGTESVRRQQLPRTLCLYRVRRIGQRSPLSDRTFGTAKLAEVGGFDTHKRGHVLHTHHPNEGQGVTEPTTQLVRDSTYKVSS